jgi:predicted TIM-barrel fold metal-dependent hydrolase
VRAVGPPNVCVHKGFGNGSRYSSPADIGPAAVAHPDISFVVYHSGYDGPEGPYTEATSDVGVNRLVRSLGDAGVPPGSNVYAELGSTWFNAMRDPTQAAHVLGKLLLAVGEDNVVWGTDSIWYGSPQGQIDAFRTFEISEELQERFGYPALTDAVKRKILGHNSARVYGVEPATVPDSCQGEPRASVDEIRMNLPAVRPLGPATAREVRALLEMHGGLP